VTVSPFLRKKFFTSSVSPFRMRSALVPLSCGTRKCPFYKAFRTFFVPVPRFSEKTQFLCPFVAGMARVVAITGHDPNTNNAQTAPLQLTKTVDSGQRKTERRAELVNFQRSISLGRKRPTGHHTRPRKCNLPETVWIQSMTRMTRMTRLTRLIRLYVAFFLAFG